MTASNNKPYLAYKNKLVGKYNTYHHSINKAYLNKLLNKYNTTYHHSINKKPIIADYSPFFEKIEPSFKAFKLKVNDRVIDCTRIYLVRVTLSVWRKKYLLLILF